MNAPRTKRRGKNAELKQSAMPLEFAAASLELALGRVVIDYTQVSRDEPSNTVTVIPSLLLPIVIKDDLSTANTKEVVTSESQSNITISSTQSNVEKNTINQEITQFKAVFASGHSSSIMTKAPAPDYVQSDSRIKTREELDYHYNGKGNAGGLSAQDHAYAAASKPVIPD